MTIAGGGRYDGLFEQLGGKPTPACGFGIGNERIMLLLQAQNLCPLPLLPDVYIVHLDTEGFANRVAESLRDVGKRVIFHAGGGSFKSQMKKADLSGARYALIIGTQEVEKGGVMLKPLRQEQEQRFIALADLASAMF